MMIRKELIELEDFAHRFNRELGHGKFSRFIQADFTIRHAVTPTLSARSQTQQHKAAYSRPSRTLCSNSGSFICALVIAVYVNLGIICEEQHSSLPMVGLISTKKSQQDSLCGHGDCFIPFSLSIVSLNNQGAKCPNGSMDTIFFLSAHCGNGPILAAGSVFVKSGL